MADLLFADFLENDETYEACVQYWRELTEGVAASLGQAGEWFEWVSRYYADGKTLIDRDLTSIYSGRSKRLDRSFEIYQHAGAPSADVVGAWMRRYGEEWESDMPSEELVISLTLSEASADIAKSLLRSWMTPATRYEDMEALIRAVP